MTDHTAPEKADSPEARFVAWFRANYPGPDTIIHKPDWHAPKIFHAATHGMVPRAEVDALVAAAYQAAIGATAFIPDKIGKDPLRTAHVILDAVEARIRALTPADAEAALRAHTEAAVSAAMADCVRLLDEAAREYNRKTNDLIARHADQIDALRDREEAAVRRALLACQDICKNQMWSVDALARIRTLDPTQFIGDQK